MSPLAHKTHSGKEYHTLLLCKFLSLLQGANNCKAGADPRRSQLIYRSLELFSVCLLSRC